MNVFQKIIPLLFLLTVSVVFSQKNKKTIIKKKIPASIYTATQISNNLNSLLNINNRLNLKSYKFIVLDETSIEMGNFLIPLYNKKLGVSNYIYDTYNKIHEKSVLEASFFKISDLYLPRTKNTL